MYSSTAFILLVAALVGSSSPSTANAKMLSMHDTHLSAPWFRRNAAWRYRRDDVDTIDPLTMDLSSTDVDQINAAYTPGPLPQDAIDSLQAASDLSVTDVDTGVAVDESGNPITTQPDPDLTDSNVYTQIPDLKGDYLLNAGADGNFHVAESGASGGGLHFIYEDGASAADDQNRVMFYFPDTMDKYGVSRFRINDFDHIPKSSRIITLLSTDLGNHDAHPTFLAADSLGNLFTMLTCTYADGTTPSKIFLAKDPYAGVFQLQDPSMQSVVTGAPIDKCTILQFVDINSKGAL